MDTWRSFHSGFLGCHPIFKTKEGGGYQPKTEKKNGGSYFSGERHFSRCSMVKKRVGTGGRTLKRGKLDKGESNL